MAKAKRYRLSVVGCDDSTVIEVVLTRGAVLMLEEIARKINEASTYLCMPRMHLEVED